MTKITLVAGGVILKIKVPGWFGMQFQEGRNWYKSYEDMVIV
jgi:hypothetical protein